MSDKKSTADSDAEIRDANACMAIGAGVGAVGVGGAVLLGAVCPICYVAAPGLIALGAWKRRQVKRAGSQSEPESKK